MRIEDLGEAALIERLASRLRGRRADVVLGIGDDVAAIALGDGRLVLLTCDAQIDGTHFHRASADPARLGRKAAAVNLSDVAAAGGWPTHLLCSLVLPPGTEVGWLEALYDGLASEAAAWGVDVIGGNVARGPALTVDVTLVGATVSGRLLRRSGARGGDRVLVTGTLGAAAAGRRLVHGAPLDVPGAARRASQDAFEEPTPRLREARVLADAGAATAAIDVSDGLARDLGHVCDASAVGVRIEAERLPIAPATRAVAAADGSDPLAWALAGGEDYELLFTVPTERAAAVAQAIEQATGTPVSDIGEVVPAAAGRTLVHAGRTIALGSDGWRHW